MGNIMLAQNIAVGSNNQLNETDALDRQKNEWMINYGLDHELNGFVGFVGLVDEKVMLANFMKILERVEYYNSQGFNVKKSIKKIHNFIKNFDKIIKYNKKSMTDFESVENSEDYCNYYKQFCDKVFL
jgi:hypothetical protein